MWATMAVPMLPAAASVCEPTLLFVTKEALRTKVEIRARSKLHGTPESIELRKILGLLNREQ